MGEPKPVKRTIGEFGQALGLVLGILCGVATLAAWLAKPEGWPYVVAMLAICAVAGILWWAITSRAEKKTDYKARSSAMVRCGGEDAGNPFFCGKMVPEWFADIDDSGPPRCGRCISGVPGGPYLARYPRDGETEEEYNAYARATGDEHNALVSEYEQLASDFAKLDGNAARVAPVPEGNRLRVEQESASDADVEHEAEKEAGAKEGRRR